MTTSAASGSKWSHKEFRGHIGTPTPGVGYEDGDLYAEFLPPPVLVDSEGESEFMRAVVFVTRGTAKGTPRSPQEYVNPLLVLSGRDYASITFADLHKRICNALRGKGPEVVAQYFTGDGDIQLILSDGRVIDSRKR